MHLVHKSCPRVLILHHGILHTRLSSQDENMSANLKSESGQATSIQVIGSHVEEGQNRSGQGIVQDAASHMHHAIEKAFNITVGPRAHKEGS